VLDRASTFADPEIIKLLQTQFVPVAIDQFAQRRQKDAEGDFWRKIIAPSPRPDPKGTTQGLYIAGPDGTFLAYNNNRGPERIRKLMLQALDDFEEIRDRKVDPVLISKPDQRFVHQPPEAMRVVRVHAKVLGGYAKPKDQWEEIFQNSVSRDTLWITTEEEEALVKERTLLPSLVRRLALYHLIDNTRGEPSFWKEGEIKQADFKLDAKGALTGRVRLARADDSSGYEADIRGVVEGKDGRLTRFDLVAHGDYWGAGRYTRQPPEGRFPLGISFRLGDPDNPLDQIRPQGAKSWWQNYVK
jgi:hypothetical protein